MSFKCLLCGNINYKLIKNGVRDSEDYKIVKCEECSHTQIYPMPTIEEDEIYYNKDLQLKDLHKDLNIIQARDKVKPEMIRRKNDVKKIVNKESKILEIGSGYGIFVEIMEQEGYSIEGIEISDVRREISSHFCKSKIYGYNIMIDEIPQHMLNKYDTIVLFHVLEHISKPEDFLSQIKKMLKKGGNIIIEVPNLDDHMLKICKEYNEFFWLRAHVSYFSANILNKLLKNSGYDNVKINGAQRYSVKNAVSWLLIGKPQKENPTFELQDDLIWIDDFYKEKLCTELKSDTLMVFANVL